MVMAVLLLIVDIQVKRRREEEEWIQTALFAGHIHVFAFIFICQPKDLRLSSTRVSPPLHIVPCFEPYANSLFTPVCEILFVLPENTLLHVACIYLLTSHNNQCITFSPLRRLWLADYHQKCLIIKWNETTVFLSFSVISVPKCGPGLCLLIIYWKHSYKISRQRPNAKMKMCSGGRRKDTCT